MGFGELSSVTAVSPPRRNVPRLPDHAPGETCFAQTTTEHRSCPLHR
jgi:hypothetical protein